MIKLSEEELVEKYFVPLSGQGSFKLRDDAALIYSREGCDIISTVDTVTAGVDFFTDASPEEVAAKALRVNLSDLAAKGAEPFGYLLALSLPAGLDKNWLERFSAQLARDQETYNLHLLGGDTTRADLLSITITCFGHVPHGKMVMRSGAKPGDLVAVTGTIGDAALGLQVLKGELQGDYKNLVERYRFPQPRMQLAPLLRDHTSAAMDISDGFAGDLCKLCAASKVSAKIVLEQVPHSQAVLNAIAQDERWRDVALTGGDDYEVLFTLAPQNRPHLEKDAKALGVSVTIVGEIVSGAAPPIFLYKKEPRVFVRESYRHF